MAEIITHNGSPALVITDHKGDDWIYPFEVVNATPLNIKVMLSKTDESGEIVKEYTVEQQGEWWTCDCKDHQCRRAPVGEACKHIESVQDVAGVIAMLTPIAEAKS